MLLHATFIWAIEFFPPRGTMNGCCKFLEVQKGIEQINERKIHWSWKLPLWIRKCMNQKLVHAGSVSVLTFKLLYLRPADAELCGPFGLTRTSVLVLWSELVSLKTWVPATAYDCPTWQKALLRGLEHWRRAPDLGVWGEKLWAR